MVDAKEERARKLPRNRPQIGCLLSIRIVTSTALDPEGKEGVRIDSNAALNTYTGDDSPPKLYLNPSV